MRCIVHVDDNFTHNMAGNTLTALPYPNTLTAPGWIISARCLYARLMIPSSALSLMPSTSYKSACAFSFAAMTRSTGLANLREIAARASQCSLSCSSSDLRFRSAIIFALICGLSLLSKSLARLPAEDDSLSCSFAFRCACWRFRWSDSSACEAAAPPKYPPALAPPAVAPPAAAPEPAPEPELREDPAPVLAPFPRRLSGMRSLSRLVLMPAAPALLLPDAEDDPLAFACLRPEPGRASAPGLNAMMIPTCVQTSKCNMQYAICNMQRAR